MHCDGTFYTICHSFTLQTLKARILFWVFLLSFLFVSLSELLATALFYSGVLMNLLQGKDGFLSLLVCWNHCTGLPKRVACIRVDGAGDEGPGDLTMLKSSIGGHSTTSKRIQKLHWWLWEVVVTLLPTWYVNHCPRSLDGEATKCRLCEHCSCMLNSDNVSQANHK